MKLSNCFARIKVVTNGTEGAKVVGESMLNGIEPRINVEHALHVLEIIESSKKVFCNRNENKISEQVPVADGNR
jgi:hypothetical protein